MEVLTSELVGGLNCNEWMDLYMMSYNIEGGQKDFIAWPDGGCYLNQDMFLVSAFRTIGDELTKMRKKSNG